MIEKVILNQKKRSEFPLIACIHFVDRLNFVFQAPLLPALDIIDNRNVTTISCPSGRKVYQVLYACKKLLMDQYNLLEFIMAAF